jgi:hypothetical protein
LNVGAPGSGPAVSAGAAAGAATDAPAEEEKVEEKEESDDDMGFGKDLFVNVGVDIEYVELTCNLYDRSLRLNCLIFQYYFQSKKIKKNQSPPFSLGLVSVAQYRKNLVLVNSIMCISVCFKVLYVCAICKIICQLLYLFCVLFGRI